MPCYKAEGNMSRGLDLGSLRGTSNSKTMWEEQIRETGIKKQVADKKGDREERGGWEE